jgi:hypothetical protein
MAICRARQHPLPEEEAVVGLTRDPIDVAVAQLRDLTPEGGPAARADYSYPRFRAAFILVG